MSNNTFVFRSSEASGSPERSISESSPRGSPSRPRAYGRNGQKERKPPSITPRKFNRFFTPRSHGPGRLSASRQALFDITAPANNRGGVQSSPLRPFRDISTQENSNPTSFTRELKRRKIIHTPESSPDDPSPSKKHHSNPNFVFEDDSERDDESQDTLPMLPRASQSSFSRRLNMSSRTTPPKRITQLGDRGLSGRLLELSLGSSSGSRRQQFRYPVVDWQYETANFYTRPEDVHLCTSIESPERCIPFCAVGCNTNSLIAVGDEEGRVRLLESAKGGNPGFGKVYLSFRPHTNAIIDMAFTEDDSLLATASGDQTARIIDMPTQTTISVLANHSASVKQVRFQPGYANNSVLATSSRDGSIQVWDLRCKSTEGPVSEIHMSPLEADGLRPRTTATYGCAIQSIYDAHQPIISSTKVSAPASNEGAGKVEAAGPGRIGDVSVTSLAFLPQGQEHLLLTASEANACVKLWDIRAVHNTRRRGPTPLAITQQPQSHNQWRHFGISSMNLSGDGTRLYTVCKDNTVYAYSTAHLMLGHAPEFSAESSRPRRQQTTQEGLGPLYGFRHPQLHATSFYVKSALRKEKNGKSELLAVGSSDGCAILFPTDERYLQLQKPAEGSDDTVPMATSCGRPGIPRTTSGLGLSSRGLDTVPISQNGTALIRGHDREVGALAWSSEGELITVGDDFLVRCWREGADARDLRIGGEAEGRRWGCGWADAETMFDNDDEE